MTILKSAFFNYFLRSISRQTYNLQKKIFRRFRVVGNVKLKIDNIHFRMYSNWDDGIVDALYFKDRNYSEINEIRLFSRFSQQSDVILDVGANTGLYSIISKISNHGSTIIAFEPYEANYERMRLNLSLNGLEDEVILVEKAVGNGNGHVEFTVPSKKQICDTLSVDSEFTNRFYRKWITYASVKVPLISLDEFISHRDIKKVSLIKIDVENYEQAVLEGSLSIIETHGPVIFIEIFVNEEKVNFFKDSIQSLGYHCYSILSSGIIRTETLTVNPDCRNFIFSKNKSLSEYLSFSDMDMIVQELMPRRETTGILQ